MFGTDSGMDEAMYRNHFGWLETADEYFDYWGYPGQRRSKIYGMNLPDTVLEKIYPKNAGRVFGQFRGIRTIQRRQSVAAARPASPRFRFSLTRPSGAWESPGP
jgi:hypothetical protein